LLYLHIFIIISRICNTILIVNASAYHCSHTFLLSKYVIEIIGPVLSCRCHYTGIKTSQQFLLLRYRSTRLSCCESICLNVAFTLGNSVNQLWTRSIGRFVAQLLFLWALSLLFLPNAGTHICQLHSLKPCSMAESVDSNDCPPCCGIWNLFSCASFDVIVKCLLYRPTNTQHIYIYILIIFCILLVLHVSTQMHWNM
jgi:hypothetical protein